ncbi:MAG TPA: hypothetical protein VIO94_09080 [Phenylobacterium sp.]
MTFETIFLGGVVAAFASLLFVLMFVTYWSRTPAKRVVAKPTTTPAVRPPETAAAPTPLDHAA